jgi:hypothetical protein
MPITADRAALIHFAGRHRLSPALREGAPALVAPADTVGRCGWAEFFAALHARGLAASLDPEDPASFRLVRAGGAAASAPAGAAPAAAPRAPGAFAEVRRFLAALRGRWPPP